MLLWHRRFIVYCFFPKLFDHLYPLVGIVLKKSEQLFHSTYQLGFQRANFWVSHLPARSNLEQFIRLAFIFFVGYWIRKLYYLFINNIYLTPIVSLLMLTWGTRFAFVNGNLLGLASIRSRSISRVSLCFYLL